MWGAINDFLSTVENYVWGIPLMALILVGGTLLTIRLGLIQVRKLPLALRWMVRNEKGGKGEVSSFAALCTSLSATIGTGNIVGVATAIGLGGPGALFWMLIAAFVGMATKYTEGLLTIKYRTVDPKTGHALGGPFYYIERGMGKGWKWLAVLFAVLCPLAALLGTGTFTQVNGVTSALRDFFDPNNAYTVAIPGIGTYSLVTIIASIILTVVVGIVLIGGIKRIATVSEVIVPFMAILYFVTILILMLTNVTAVPAAFGTIIKGAFDPAAVTGGVVGGIFVAMQSGIARGIFSNEAGLGTGPIAAASAKTKEPVRQGLV
ncbi:MAG: amino acid carrier protein, partial [Lachnospiraceae bacterium]|nr:amino acid carrier protein [Lachnospiraceae bacterium]